MFWVIIKYMLQLMKKINNSCVENIILICLIGVLSASCASNVDPVPKAIGTQNYSQKLKIVWQDNQLQTSNANSFVPAVDNKTIFTADSDGNVYRIDQTDGTIIQKWHFKRKFSSGTAVSEGHIFVTTLDGYLLSIDRGSGKITWQAQLPTIAIEAPQAGNGTVVVKTNDSQVLAYNTSNGNLLWIYQKQTPPLTLRTYNSFQLIAPDVVIVGEPGGRLVLLNLISGMAIWENYIAIPTGATDLDKLTDVSTRPVINNKEICAVTYNGKLACLDAISSNIIWSKTFSTSYGILLDDNNVYAASLDATIYAFDKNSGELVWTNNEFQYRKISSLVFLNGNILIIDNNGNMFLLDHSSGKIIAQNNSNLEGGVAYPYSDGSHVIYQSSSGVIAEIAQ
jgi:outer membrane protein assembly factor BamB